MRTAKRVAVMAGAGAVRLAAVAAMAAALGPVGAADAPSAPAPGRTGLPKDAASAREAAAARGNPASAVLTREELRRCVVEQKRLSAETDSVAEAQRALERDRAEIARLSAELKVRAERLDRTDAAAVAAYNAQAEARNALVARHDAAVAQANAQVAALEPARLAWSRDCAERAFRPEDRQAIEAGR